MDTERAVPGHSYGGSMRPSILASGGNKSTVLSIYDPTDGFAPIDYALARGLPLAALQSMFLRAVRNQPLLGPLVGTEVDPVARQLQLEFDEADGWLNDEAYKAPPPMPDPGPSVDEAAAAVLLAGIFHRHRRLLRTFHQQDAVLLLRVPDPSLSGPVWRGLRPVVLRCCQPLDEADIIARRPSPVPLDREAVGLIRKPDAGRPDRVAAADDSFMNAVRRAAGLALPTIVTVPSDRLDLIARITPHADHDLSLPSLTSAAAGAIVRLVTTADPGITEGAGGSSPGGITGTVRNPRPARNLERGG